MSAAGRKPSWEIADLAWKTRTDTISAKLLLVFLGKCANNAGESWHGYASIRRHTGLSRDSVTRAAKYLRDRLKVLTWERGGGTASNRYRLNLEAMRQLVAAQESDSAATPRTAVGILPRTTVGIPPHDGAERPPVGAATPHDGAARPVRLSGSNPKEPSMNSQKTTLNEPGPGSVFLEESPTSKIQDSSASAERQNGQGRAPSPKHGVSGNVPFAWGDPVAGLRFVKGEDCGYVCMKTGRRLEFQEARRLAQAQAAAA